MRLYPTMQRKGTTFCVNFALPAPYYRGFRGSVNRGNALIQKTLSHQDHAKKFILLRIYARQRKYFQISLDLR